MDWNRLAEKSLEGEPLSIGEGISVLRAPESALLDVLAAAARVRFHHHGRRVRLHVLMNAQSGACPEDCRYCSQSAFARTPIERYRLQPAEEIVAAARRAHDAGAWKFCIVTAGRAPSEHEVGVIGEAVRRIKAEMPLHICTSLGILEDTQARRLAESGVDRYNHNLETSRRFFPEICSTHTWDERVGTVQAAMRAGMEACCGGIIGVGENLEDRVELALAVRRLGVTSVPVNFFDPRPGTPLGERTRISALDALRALALFRLANPTADVRAAGGREVTLGTLQPLALWAASSIFTHGYLTTPGAGEEFDRRMIAEAGFEVEEGAREVPAHLAVEPA